MATAVGVEVRTRLQSAPTTGDPVSLERLTHNLIDNAIRYNLPEDGEVIVSTGVVDGFVVLTVDNTGPVVAAYEVPSLFEPFRRLAATDPRSATPGYVLLLEMAAFCNPASLSPIHSVPPASRRLAVLCGQAQVARSRGQRQRVAETWCCSAVSE